MYGSSVLILCVLSYILFVFSVNHANDILFSLQHVGNMWLSFFQKLPEYVEQEEKREGADRSKRGLFLTFYIRICDDNSGQVLSCSEYILSFANQIKTLTIKI